MGAALEIGGELSADGVRRAARREKGGRAAARMHAIAHALDGLSRADAARLAGMERQALRDAVLRHNAEGLSGLRDRPRDRPRGRPRGRPPRRLTAAQEVELAEACLARPDPVVDGGSRLDARRSLPLDRDALRQDLSPFEPDQGAPAARLLARDRRGLITLSAMPRREAGLQKGGLAEQVAAAAERHPDKRIELWFESLPRT